jgi:hypothetical protein
VKTVNFRHNVFRAILYCERACNLPKEYEHVDGASRASPAHRAARQTDTI